MQLSRNLELRRPRFSAGSTCLLGVQPRSLTPAVLPRRCQGRLWTELAAYLGLDFGTSGARGTVINDDGKVLADVKRGYGDQAQKDWAAAWQRVLFELIGDLDDGVRSEVQAVAFDGTSATALLVERGSGRVLLPAKLYNEAQPKDVVAAAKLMAPPAHTAASTTSTLPKLLTWQRAGVLSTSRSQGLDPGLLHQADWLASLLHGQRNITDWNNSLKLGYDPGAEAYPAWLLDQEGELVDALPHRVVPPGAPVAPVMPEVAARTGLPPSCMVCAGTTDSIAAFIAAGVGEAGQAVTSLGSTLALKLLSTTRVDDATYGIYSHRLGDVWLVGGASNTGGAVLRQHFTDAQLRELSDRMDPSRPTGLHYYPLPSPGERFPVSDPDMQPRMQPRPADDAQFLQGIFEGIARIEAEAYVRLAAMGASPLKEVHSAGGGAVNPKWTAIRAKALGVPVVQAANGDASYGAALLARQGARQASLKATV